MGYFIIFAIIAIFLFFVPIIFCKGEDKCFAFLCFIPLFAILIFFMSIKTYHNQCYIDIADYDIIKNTNIDNITSIESKSEIYKKIIRINNNIEKNNKNKESFWNGIWYDERYEYLELIKM